MTFQDDIKAEAKQYGAGSGDQFEFQKGINKLRILVQPKILATHFFGKGNPSHVCVGIDEGCEIHSPEYDNPSLKLVTYFIDRTDNKIKLAELPLSISYALNDLQEDEDFAFEGFPMPFDVKITHDPDNKDPKAKYRLVGSPQRVELTEEEQKELADNMSKMTPEQYVEKRKAKEKAKGGVTDPNVANEANVADYPENDGKEVPF